MRIIDDQVAAQSDRTKNIIRMRSSSMCLVSSDVVSIMCLLMDGSPTIAFSGTKLKKNYTWDKCVSSLP